MRTWPMENFESHWIADEQAFLPKQVWFQFNGGMGGFAGLGGELEPRTSFIVHTCQPVLQLHSHVTTMQHKNKEMKPIKRSISMFTW